MCRQMLQSVHDNQQLTAGKMLFAFVLVHVYDSRKSIKFSFKKIRKELEIITIHYTWAG